jgi:hypothetical protein
MLLSGLCIFCVLITIGCTFFVLRTDDFKMEGNWSTIVVLLLAIAFYIYLAIFFRSFK